MKYGLLLAAIVVGVALFSYPGVSLAQGTDVSSPALAPAATTGMGTGSNEPDVLWLWGDVVSVDTDKNEVTVKYLDYESDTEKEITVGVNDKTVYENIKFLGELKAQDTVSIDYSAADGKNTAKNISVEKPEGMEPAKEEAATNETPDVQAVPLPSVTPPEAKSDEAVKSQPPAQP